MQIWHDSIIYDMTHSSIHTFIRDLSLRDMSHSYVTWLIHIWHDCFAHSYLTWLNQIWPDVFIENTTQAHVTWLIHSSIHSFVTCLYVTPCIHIWHDCLVQSYLMWLNQMWHDVFIIDMTQSYVTWRIHIWHDCWAHSYLTRGSIKYDLTYS